MLAKTLLAALASAAFATAQTPAGFSPGSTNPLIVSFGGIGAMKGAVVARASTQTAPTIALSAPAQGTFAVLMIDLDIPVATTPTTLLHWMQTGLSVSSTAVQLNTTQGSMTAHVLENRGNTEAFASYVGPSPPALNPLSHRYTQILVDMTGASEQALASLKNAALTRINFDTAAVFAAAGVAADKVVAGNFFNVTNPGPAGSGQLMLSGTPTSSGGAATGTPGAAEQVVNGAGRTAAGLMGALVGVAGMFLVM